MAKKPSVSHVTLLPHLKQLEKAHALALMLEKTIDGLEIDRIEEARKHSETLRARYHGGLDFGYLL